ncbi:MAG: hypothetical protein IRZ16_05660 [Myxococcaceae bacterium]|nr:hypothetical protein [Myxococcaceae bacterium]
MKTFVGAIGALAMSLCWMGCSGAECSASTPCPEGQQCSAEGICVADTGPSCDDTSRPEAPNLISNPGFECGVADWQPYVGPAVVKISEETSNPKSGSKAMRIQYTETAAKQSRVAAFGKEIPVTGGETICYRAFMRGTGRNGHIVVRESRPGGGFDTSYSSPITLNDWVEVPPSVALRKITVGNDTTSVHVRFELRQPADQDTLIVDDVALWRSPDGSCSER